MRPTRRLLLSSVFIGIMCFAGGPRAAGPSTAFYGIGDLPGGGGATTIIKDATHAGGVIYAVGGAVSRMGTSATQPPPPTLACFPAGICPFTDTAILWRSDTGIAQALPDILTPPLTITTRLTATAITADAAFIAAQARAASAGNVRHAVRVTTASLTNLDLADAPFLTLGNPSTAVAISSAVDATTTTSGRILYGNNSLTRGIRFDVHTATTTVVPTVAGTDTQNPVASRGTSADGAVAVGTSFSAASNHKAYRYVHGSGVTQIPFLAGGGSNDALAVSPDGDLVLVTGPSSNYPNGEAYLYRASTGTTTALGSPNSIWRPGARLCAAGACQPGVVLEGGMTSDGSVVAMSFSGNDGQYAYFRNAHGWFHLTSALAAGGVDIRAQGWNNLQVHGMSSDGTLVFGAGEHNDIVEGFVAEFGVDVLKNFNPAPTPPINTALVGVWTFDTDNLASPGHVVVFAADGSYYHIESNSITPNGGNERGVYTFDGSHVSWTTLIDHNGTTGLSDDNGTSNSASVVGDTLYAGADPVGQRITGTPGSFVGGWLPAPGSGEQFTLVLTSGRYFSADDHGAEVGTYTYVPATGELSAFPFGGAPDPGNFLFLSANGLVLHHIDDGGDEFDLHRVIDPATIPAIASTPLSASGVVGQPFAFDVNATNAATYTATGLPANLSINPTTGEITGTPAVGGQFQVTVLATSTVGVSDIETLALTIAIPTPIGPNISVQPVVPEGQGPITLTFGQVTSAGTTTVTVIEESEVPPPGNVSVGGVIYEVSTTANYQGLITLCFSYAGIDFGNAQPRLFHYENNAWVDITLPGTEGVNPETQTICGSTTTLSPFAVLVSDIVREGFYKPVSQVPGHLNVVKGGSTVPLKFNVYVNGVEQTTTAGLEVTEQVIACDPNMPLDPVEPEEAIETPGKGKAGLRYEKKGKGPGHFIVNWKVPKEKHTCYMIRMTTQQDDLALTARFRVK